MQTYHIHTHQCSLHYLCVLLSICSRVYIVVGDVMKLQQNQRAQLSNIFQSNSLSTTLHNQNNNNTYNQSTTGQSPNNAINHWKVLIYDDIGQCILSPLYTSKQLNQFGVTLYMNIKQRRDAIADVPAVYFVKPTHAAIQAICDDINSSLYATYNLYFTSPIKRAELEYLAKNTIQHSKSINILYDTYIDFVCLDSQLITFNHHDSYISLNNPHTSEQLLFQTIDTIVDQLFTMCVTMQQVPVIRCRPGEAAEQVAMRLDSKLRDHLQSKNNLFLTPSTQSFTSTTRPLLIILDRNIDLNAPLCHSWSYESLLNDVLSYSNNKVSIIDSDGSQKRHTYDLNTSEDSFWSKYHHSVFHDVAAAVSAKQQKYQDDVKAIQSRTGQTIDPNNPLAATTAVFDSSSASAGISDALNVLPKMQKTKRIIDTHLNIATALLKQVQTRELQTFCSSEIKFIADKSTPKAELMKLISSGESVKPGTFVDQLRAFLIYYLGNEHANESLINDILPLLQSQSSDSTQRNLLYAIEYVKEFKFVHRLGSDVSAGVSAQPAPAQSITRSAGLLGNLASGLFDQASELFNSAKQLLPVTNDLPVTRIVDLLINNHDTVDTANYSYFDPKNTKHRGAITQPQLMSTTPFSNSCVFMLGGGSYNEHQNIQSYAKQQTELKGIPHTRIITVRYIIVLLI